MKGNVSSGEGRSLFHIDETIRMQRELQLDFSVTRTLFWQQWFLLLFPFPETNYVNSPLSNLTSSPYLILCPSPIRPLPSLPTFWHGKYLYAIVQAALTEDCRLGHLDNRNLFSHSSGDQKSEIQVLVG